MDALPRLAPVSRAYATMPVGEAFNWADGATELGEGSWYLVAFRSIRRPGADEERLSAYDEFAHQEATGAPGFVHYLKGPAADDGSCLSFCLWQSREQARAAARRPAHIRAVGLLDEMYAHYRLEFHAVRRTADGTMTFEPIGEVAPVTHPDPASAPASPALPLSVRPAIAG